MSDRDFRPGDVVRNFKRETVDDDSQRYLYRIIAFARHTETEEELVVYEALYPPFGVWCRPRAMFESEVDHAKYPDIKQRWRFEKADGDALTDNRQERKSKIVKQAEDWRAGKLETVTLDELRESLGLEE